MDRLTVLDIHPVSNRATVDAALTIMSHSSCCSSATASRAIGAAGAMVPSESLTSFGRSGSLSGGNGLSMVSQASVFGRMPSREAGPGNVAGEGANRPREDLMIPRPLGERGPSPRIVPPPASRRHLFDRLAPLVVLGPAVLAAVPA